MKHQSLLPAMTPVVCVLLLLGSRVSIITESQEKIDKSAHSDRAKKKKASTDHAAERGHQNDGKIAKHNDELPAKHRKDAETLKHKDELAKHHGDRQPSRDNDQWA